ncbi:extracellular solute-binding protein family 5 [Oscillochloris trichoides DG-6]|uniref:Extracellular solute-binding protein family 5 n=1 Tax=Oscillochloris trichoides DG-6 TaxID=765420 RepID=E1IAJ4_9CHLR|nr:peptide ABC transporter substrate-binding protein [Oscillochloris trichoides]EFO81768.1 extracellular solute-binding protein family 5 [Oscillochloris trichoides DG-6]
MARRIRWQIVIAALSILIVSGLLGRLALRNTVVANPLSGGSYREVLLGAPIQPIPILNDPRTDPVGRDLGTLLFDGLMRIGADGLPEPGLAAGYEVDPEGLVYTFRLRQGVTWHDGTALTADDVVFTLRALQSLAQPGEPALAKIWQDVLVDRVDDLTVRCTLPAPMAAFLSVARVPILPAHLLAGTPPEAWANTGYATTLVGTGPFSLRELRTDGAVLVANPNYYAGRPYLDSLELRFTGSLEAARAALTRADASAYGERVDASPDPAQSLAQANLADRLRRNLVPLDGYTQLTFNLRTTPLDNLTFRQALAHGLSRNTLIQQVMAGMAQPINTPILPGSWAYNPEIAWYRDDKATASKILGELGYTPGADGMLQRDGEPLRLDLIVDAEPSRRAAADEVVRQWAEIGVAVQVEEVSSAELQRRLAEHAFTLAIHSWSRLGPDPDVYTFWHSLEAFNYAGLADPEIDSLLESAHDEREIGARSADYATFQRRWIELAPSILLYQPIYVFVSEQNLGGVGMAEPESASSQILFGTEDRYRTVSRWFINSYREIQGDLR